MIDLVRVRDAFRAALAAAPAEREATLRRVCGDDVGLIDEVRGLLAHHASAEGFLEPNAAEAARAREAARTWLGAPSPGERIGSYTVRTFVGAGRLGLVYEAEQDEPRRTVALKIIRPGIAGPSATRRFVVESQALLSLRHAGIARVFEAGTAQTPAGALPFVAMELVKGVSLGEWSRAARPGLRPRLEVMAGACEAIGYAHAHGVIHCDVKPSNILVDEAGSARIVDFGVARLGISEARGSRNHSEADLPAGTAGYWSPEQAAGDWKSVGPTADVYALGVVLKELAAGCGPGEAESPADRALRAAVDGVVVKATARDPRRRYSSARGMAEALRRGLGGESGGRSGVAASLLGLARRVGGLGRSGREQRP
ncbi:MAG: serine/threonine-protein kinase [Phycisphaerales bacterium]